MPIRGSISFRLTTLVKSFPHYPKIFVVPGNQDEKPIMTSFPKSKVFRTQTSIPRFSCDSKALAVTSFSMEATLKISLVKSSVKAIYAFGPLVTLFRDLAAAELPMILDVHETDFPALKFQHQTSALQFMYNCFEALLAKFIDKIVGEVFVLTKAMGNYLIRKYSLGVRVNVAYDGTDPSIFRPLPMQKKTSNPTLVFTGDIDVRDGVDLLIRSFERVIKEHSEARLFIIGNGPSLPSLRAMVRKLRLGDKVIFTGWINFSELVMRLPYFSVGVISSRPWLINELIIPRKTFEFMAAGVPIVAPNLTAMREVVENGVSGLLYNLDCKDALTESILRLLSDRTLYEKIQREGRKVAETFSVDNEVAKIERSLLNYLVS